MSKPKSSWADIRVAEARFSLLWLAAGLLDFPLLVVMSGYGFPIPAPWVALLHFLGAVAMFMAPAREKGWFRPTRHWGEFMGVTALMVPGVGWFIGGWLILWHAKAHLAKDAYRFESEAADDINPLAAAGSPASVRKELADALDVVPAADALLGRDPALKRGAIEALAKMRTSDAIAWIFKARTDPDAEIRFYATSTLTQLKRDFETSLRAAEKESFSRPGEVKLQVSLQRVRYEYCRSGLLDPGSRDGLLEHCRQTLLRDCERDIEALRMLFHVERELSVERALALIDRLIQGEPHRKTAWLQERTLLLFQLGRCEEARACMLELRPALLHGGGSAMEESEEVEWRSSALWWTNG